MAVDLVENFEELCKAHFASKADMLDSLEIPDSDDTRGDAIHIWPIKIKKYGRNGLSIYSDECDIEFGNNGFSVEEFPFDDVFYYFMDKYFDKHLKWNKLSHEDCWDMFGENYFTYESIRDMIDELEKVCNLIENDYDNTCLEFIKRKNYGEHKVTLPKYIVKKYIRVYKAFVEALKTIIKNNPDFDLILFAGP